MHAEIEIGPSGNKWEIATHVEDVPPNEMKKRMKTMAAGG